MTKNNVAKGPTISSINPSFAVIIMNTNLTTDLMVFFLGVHGTTALLLEAMILAVVLIH